MTKPTSRKHKTRKSGASKPKSEQVITLLGRPTGASIAEMMKATGWQAHSVRGFMSGTLVKRRRLTLGSEKVDGERRYQIQDSGDRS